MATDHPTPVCFPDYQTNENYQAFLKQLPPEQRAMAKPFDEAVAAREGIVRSMPAGMAIVVKVTAAKWIDWCRSKGLPMTIQSISAYGIWLYASSAVGENIENIRGKEFLQGLIGEEGDP